MTRSRREKARLKQRKESGRACARKQMEEGIANEGVASEYFHHLDAIVRELRQEQPKITIHALLYARVSTRQQWANGTIDGQVLALRDECKRLDIEVTDEYMEQESAKVSKRSEKSIARLRELFRAARRINKTDDGTIVIIIGESPCRFVRNEGFHPTLNDEVLPTKEDFETFFGWFRNSEKLVPFATRHHPDIPLRELRKLQSERGQTSIGGRPRKPHYRQWPPKTKDLAKQMRKEGKSLGSIAKKLGAPKATIQYWTRDIPHHPV